MTRRVSRTVTLAAVVLGLLLVDGTLVYKRHQYGAETARLREGMSTVERVRADAILADDATRSRLMMQLLQRQAEGDDALHLAVSVDSSFVALDRGSVRLRVMPATLGPERRVGVPPDTIWVAVPRGMRTVDRVTTAKDSVELPRWIWLDRGLGVPETRVGEGWLGPYSVVVAGGTMLYSMPEAGPLSDSSYVMPGAIRLSASDLAAVRENITPGMRVYFY